MNGTLRRDEHGVPAPGVSMPGLHWVPGRRPWPRCLTERRIQIRDVLSGGGATIREVEAASGASLARILSMVLGGGLELAGREAITRDSVVSIPGRGAAR